MKNNNINMLELALFLCWGFLSSTLFVSEKVKVFDICSQNEKIQISG